MLMRIWTGFLLLGLCASLVALAFVCMREKGFRPYVDLWAKFRRLPLRRQIAVVMFVVGMWVYASVKPGDISPERSEHCEAMSLEGCGSGGDGGGDGTNNVQMVVGPVGGLQQMGSPGAVTNTLGHGIVGEIRPMAGGVLGDPAPLEDEWSDFAPITSTNTARTLTGDDFQRGVVMTRVGTDEEFDFALPQDATIVSDWQAFGAATDWVYVALTNWAFSVATNDVERLRVYSFGKIEPLIREAGSAIATNYWFAPFMASLGVVPEANWSLLNESARPSRVWYCVTHRNTFVVTWENVLLDRDAGSPISFQVEFWPDGRFVYRYDLSRCGAETVTNILAGVSFAGNEWTTNSLPTNITSMAFCPLLPGDAYDEDSDGDGVATIDELFVHCTDPHNADTDYDGLADGEESLVYETDPLDPNSISAAYCDGFAAQLGELDPFSCPEGSTNTVLEHIFYSGTTNGIVAYPTSTVDTAVLKVMVSGVGTGRLVVGDAVVPLVAPPQLRSGAVTNTLLLEVGRGVRKEVWFTKPDGLDVALRSDDLLIGSLPNLFWPHGWIAFPHTDATIPCIHDLCAEQRWVSLVHGEEFPGLTATWESESVDIEIWNDGIVTAEITGHFPKNASRAVMYTVDHPNRLNPTPKTFQQTVRFCPRLAESDLAEYGIEDEDAEPSGGWCMCGLGCDWCYGRCSGNCPCCMAQVLDETTEEAAAAEYARIASLQEESGILQLYGPSGRADSVLLQVPAGEPIHCCECPEHWQSNHVALAWRSQRLSVLDSSDADFVEAFENVQVRVLGTAPSPAVGADAVLFATNGTPSACRRYTVLGVDIESVYGVPLEKYNSKSAAFGFPVTVNTNLDNAASLYLITDVLLTNGVFRLALENCVGAFEIWAPERTYCDYSGVEPVLVTIPAERILDSETQEARHFTVRQWRQMVSRHAGGGRGLDVLVLSSATGHCDFAFSYAFDNDGSAIRSSACQRITSVRPPLLPDYNGDGMIDAADFELFMRRRTFRFWTNNEKVKGRYVGDGALSTLTLNIANDTVDGDYDLLNFFPLALDLAQFPQSWKSGLLFKLKSPGSGDASFNYCLLPGAWAAAGEMYTNDVLTVSGETLSAAHVTPVNLFGASLPMDSIGEFSGGHGLVVAEAMREGASLRLSVVDSSGYEFYGFTLPSMIVDVERMYRWANLRPTCGDSSGEASDLADPLWNPDSESDGRHFVFVHGYNVNAESARVWADQMFKRLWVAGSRSMFTAVDWYGDSSQYYSLIYMDTVSPDYYANVMHAFMTASNLVDTVASLPGTNKVMLAHSLGNMLVSSAAVDHNLQYDRYYMLNAAVPMEAYDAEEASSNMIDLAWRNVPLNYRASGWSKLFAASTNDFRCMLSWQGRFAGIAKAVNCYSPTEDVLENAAEHGYGSSWAKQELFKGTAVWHGLNTVLFFNDSVSCEGGWGINTYYAANPTWYTPGVGFYSSVSNLTRETAIEHPLFTPFRAEADAMHSTNIFTIADADYCAQLRAKFLGDAIPAISFAAGANPVSTNAVCGNINYENCKSGVWPIGEGQWRHSDIKNVAYFFNWKLFRCMINNDGGDNNETQQQNGD